MLNIVIKTALNDSQIQGLYQLYLHQNDGLRGTKKDFIEYCKNQVLFFGVDEFLLSSDMSLHKDLTIQDINQLMVWGLI
jgi:hypothetical protein